jgi:acyl-CoA synthetase (AMP-forming)/AMP-acid ligase II
MPLAAGGLMLGLMQPQPLLLSSIITHAARHPKWMERPLLLVVPREGCTLDPRSILALYDGAVAKWWLPDDVVVVDELPHTATGKLNKLALRARYADHLLQREAAQA